MHDSAGKRFLTTETGELYQLIRLAYSIQNRKKLLATLSQLSCIRVEKPGHTWAWYWEKECADMRFHPNGLTEEFAANPVRLATLSLSGNKLYIYLSSFKRACMAIPFFHQALNETLSYADFINKIFSSAENLPVNISQLYQEDELNHSAHNRTNVYAQIEKQFDGHLSTQDARGMINEVVANKSKWEMPYVERYIFEWLVDENPQVIFMAFYLFLRSRELVRMKSAAGNPNYRLNDVVDETLRQAFGTGMQDKNLAPICFRAQALFQGYIKPGGINIFC